MKLTLRKLENLRACEDGIEWYKSNGLTDVKEIVDALVAEKKYAYANWLLPRLMKRKDCIRFAIYCAELCLPDFEREFPDDDRPRKAIEAAKAVLKKDTKANRDAARNAAYDASSAARSAACSVAWNAANAASSAARSAAWNAACSAAYAACSAAWNAACSAAYAACSASYDKIYAYGLSLLGY